MTKDEALKLALEALDHNLLFTSMMPGYDGRIIEKAYKAINKALAQERSSDEQPAQTDWEAVAADQAMTIALLRAEQPPQRKPLTDEECDRIYTALDQWAREFDQYEFGLPTHCGDGMIGGRAIIRAAHGIKGDA